MICHRSSASEGFVRQAAGKSRKRQADPLVLRLASLGRGAFTVPQRAVDLLSCAGKTIPRRCRDETTGTDPEYRQTEMFEKDMWAAKSATVRGGTGGLTSNDLGYGERSPMAVTLICGFSRTQWTRKSRQSNENASRLGPSCRSCVLLQYDAMLALQALQT